MFDMTLYTPKIRYRIPAFYHAQLTRLPGTLNANSPTAIERAIMDCAMSQFTKASQMSTKPDPMQPNAMQNFL